MRFSWKALLLAPLSPHFLAGLVLLIMAGANNLLSGFLIFFALGCAFSYGVTLSGFLPARPLLPLWNRSLSHGRFGMRQSLLTALIAVCMAAGPSSAQDQSAPKEENCRNAIEAGLEQLRRIPPDLKQRDDEDRRKLLADMERLVETNRRAGVSECRTWTLMMGKAFNQ